MISTIISGGSPAERDEKVKSLCESLAIQVLDRHIFSQVQQDEKEQGSEKMGISLIRKIQQKMLFKPLYSETSAVILQEAQSLTLPAQQALLKILEEPPPHTVIFMTVDNEALLLPTIYSRCRIMRIQNHDEEPADELTKKLLTSSQSSLGERLILAELLAKDPQSKSVVKLYIQELRKRLLKAIASKDEGVYIHILASQASKAQEMYNLLIDTIANQRLLFEHFLLSF